MVRNSNYDKLEYRVENSKSKTINAALNNIQKLMFRLLFFITFAFILLVMPSLVLGGKHKNILILNSYHKGFDWTDAQVSAAKQVLLEKFRDIELYVEYMDTKRIYTAEYIEHLMKTFKLKYKNKKLDAIITTDDNALKFVMKYHEELFAKAPVSFCGINDYQESMFEDKKEFTGLVEILDIKPTIDLALKLHPSTRKVVVIVDNTPTGIGQRKDVAAVAPQYENLKFEYLKGEDLSNEELFEKLQKLSRDSIVLLTVWLRDKNNDYLPTHEGGHLISSNATVPVYGIIDMYMGQGITGGKLLNSRTHGKTAAEIALRILDGERPSDIPVLIKSTNPYMFDYQQLDRWGISLSALPEGSIVINKPFSIYDEYKHLIWSVVAIIVLLVVFVAFLAGNIQHRKRVEEAFRESEARFKDLASFLPLSLFESDDQGNITFANPFAFESTGYTQDDIDKSLHVLQVIHPEDHDKAIKMSMQVMQGVTTDGSEYLVQRKDGSTFPAFINTRASIKADKTVGLKGYIFNLTEQKMAKEALRESEEKLRQSQKLESIGTLAGGIAHDFNNILFPISGYTEMLLLDTPDDSPQHHSLSEILAGAKRAGELVKQILTFSRQRQHELKPLKVEVVVKEALKLIRSSLPTTIEILHNINKDYGLVMADPTQIHQITMNLCTNAFHAMEETGGKLTITLKEVELETWPTPALAWSRA